MSPRTVEVRIGAQPYDVLVGAGLLSRLGRLTIDALDPKPKRILLIADDELPEGAIRDARGSLDSAGFSTHLATAHASEPEKSLDRFAHLHVRAADAGIDRNDALVALGGGIIGDLAGFVAATHRRGVRIIQCPTTLLAMVDASVGGKTGVNLEASGMLLKNFVGSFHQPARVIASVDTLGSLPDRQFRSGLAECIKHSLISADSDPDLGQWTSAHLDAILQRDPAALVELIARNVAVKARIVEGDERETVRGGGRALLNLGHTFAHAIETIPNLTPDKNESNAPLLHGEAVALGLIAAATCAVELGDIPPSGLEEAMKLIHHAGLPLDVRGLPPPDVVVARMHRDKKALGGSLRLVLPCGPARARVVETPPLNAVTAAINAISTPT